MRALTRTAGAAWVQAKVAARSVDGDIAERPAAPPASQKKSRRVRGAMRGRMNECGVTANSFLRVFARNATSARPRRRQGRAMGAGVEAPDSDELAPALTHERGAREEQQQRADG